ncbi:MAG: FkbM family methyltransferase [Acidimicrobiales bacterium]
MIAIRQIDLHSFLDILDDESVVVDLGMSDGAFAREVASRFGCRVFGVEPNPTLFAAMPHMEQIVKEQVAMGPTDGPVTLYLNTKQCASTQFDLADTSVVVTGVTLTSFLDRHAVSAVDLLKIDIEGAEFDVLASVNDSDMMRIRQLTIEFHDFLDPRLLPRVRAADRRLRQLGFRRMKFSHSTNGDVLYVHPAITLSIADRLAILVREKYLPGLRRRMGRTR